jgi:hypothetical protein
MNEENTTEQELTESEAGVVSAVRQQRLLHIFMELGKSKRFTEFVDNNFDIVDQINDEEKSITTLVVEKPMAVGPQMSAKQVANIHKIIAASGTDKVGDTMRKLLETLGQDDSGLIVESGLDASQLKI